FPEEDVIDLELIEKVAGGKGDEIEKKNFLEWLIENLDIKLSYKEYSAVYDDRSDKLIKIFDIRISSKSNYNYESYVFFNDLKNLKIEGGRNIRYDDNTAYFKLNENDNLVFSTTSDVDFINLPMYISPSLSKLPIKINQELICNEDRYAIKTVKIGKIALIANQLG
ncbi:MAG: hypothetical protein AABY22_36780, partial [Nanoarchaeota archaeon]